MQIRSGRTIAPSPMDALDGSIVEILRINGRATNQEIAEQLSVTAATVSARLQRMEEARVMRVVAVTDFAAHGYDLVIPMGVCIKGRNIEEAGLDLASLPQVLSVNIMNGPHDLELLVALRSFDEVQDFLTKDLAKIPGVTRISPGIAADIVKFEFNVVPL